jgi:hypothetical protein
MIVQADEYEREQNMKLDSFFTSTQDYFTHPEVRKKEARWKSNINSKRMSACNNEYEPIWVLQIMSISDK